MQDSLTQDILAYIGYGITVVTIIILINGYSRLSLNLKVFSTFILASFASDTISIVFTKFYGMPNMWVFDIYTLVEFASIGAFFLILLYRTKNFKIILYGLILMLAFMIYLITTQHSDHDLNRNSTLIETIVFIVLSVYYFYHMLNKMEFDSPYSDPIFWINSGILVLFSVSFFLFMFSSDIFQALGIWILHNIAQVIFKFLVLIGFWKATRKIYRP